MTRLVRQRTPHQCMIACIVMATHKPYRQVLTVGIETGGYVEGRGCLSEQKILTALGLRFEFERGRPSFSSDYICLRRSYHLSADAFRDQAWGRRAIFTVPSLNNPGGHHAVYWDGQKLLDPNSSDRKRYADWSELQPSELVLFREFSL